MTTVENSRSCRGLAVSIFGERCSTFSVLGYSCLQSLCPIAKRSVDLLDRRHQIGQLDYSERPINR